MSDNVRIKDLMLVHDTGKAILVRDPKLKVEAWIPKSMIDYQFNLNDIITIEIPEWLAKKSKLDYE